ncbi:NAD-dependent epimerase/dehydratase family protein [Sphingomonas lutea]|uniref:NAD-dependent epimerase/dehydratase family protein n=1 Tax=Sphingomonas lutea TaxID=1045317 RepID=A0A7G9SH08_9SPHN|nr:NAD-dependent epimerase/dehydratase family protein [Sphingomonas lutea]QNN67133.1 NAD-dependent epimerase/dehydratase family protein [Sphingomonas lutea]
MIGAGYILKSHVAAVSELEQTVLHAVADISESRARLAAHRFGFERAYSSVEQLAQSECDVVHVLVPPSSHIAVAEAMLRAGKSVFLEKPMGLSGDECRRLASFAAEQGCRIGVNHNFLFLPGYEEVRSFVLDGALGRIDHLSCSWLYELPQIRNGPANAWMLSAPANLIYELGPHIAAFVLDIMGDVEVTGASAGDSLQLATGQTVYRSWNIHGRSSSGTFTLSISTRPGQPDRYLRLRGAGGSAQVDFGRDIHWIEGTQSTNPIFDALAMSRSIARQLRSGARKDLVRRFRAAIGKRAGSTSFDESMLRSISVFYSLAGVDSRHDGEFGAKVIELCDAIARASNTGSPSTGPICVPEPVPEIRDPARVLVVGGSGFIGRKLVAKLVDKGQSVRVLTRSRASAAIAFAGLPIEIHEGSHGDPATAKAALVGIETVYHLAKCEGKNWADYERDDIEPTGVLADAAIAAGVKRFVYTGTIDSYASHSSELRITADTPLDPKMHRRNFYARSKARCESLLQDLSVKRGLPLIIARPGIVIGSGAPVAHVGVAHFDTATNVRFWGDGENKLPLVLVDDVADALAAALEAPNVVGRCVLITSCPLLSAREYIAAASAGSGSKISVANQPPWRWWIGDLVKELVKNAIRHPNRRWPSLHDWRCRTHRAVYDSTSTRLALNWSPASNRETLVNCIYEAARAEMK